MAESRDLTGINVIDHDAEEPLTVLVRSINQESCLHPQGAGRVQNNLLRILSNRLRMLRDFSAHPEIAQQKIQQPVFITGSVRTGSTKLQRLLAETGDFNYLPYWMALNSASYTGYPDEDILPRVQDGKLSADLLHDNSPGAMAVHDLRHDVAEEDTFVLMQSLYAGGFLGYAETPGYNQWLAGQDPSKAYDYLLNVLKYLQWQGLYNPEKRWMLKSPFHCGMEDVLLSRFPDASLLATHRPAEQLMPSMCSMLIVYRLPYTFSKVDSIGLCTGLAAGLERHVSLRQQSPDLPVLDVDYRALRDDASSVIDQIYKYVGISLGDTTRKTICEWEKNHPIHKSGAHSYSLQDFGMSLEYVRQLTPDYSDFYQSMYGSGK